MTSNRPPNTPPVDPAGSPPNGPSDDAHSLSGPYVLDALPPTERDMFELHLAECETCQLEVDEFRATATRLGAATETAPPPGLKARVLAEINQTRQLPPLPREHGELREHRASTPATGTAPHTEPDTQPGVASRHRLAPVIPLWRRPRLLAAAAVLAIAAGGAGIGVAALESSRSEQAIQARDEITAIVSAPDSRTLHTAVNGGGRVTLVVSTQRDAAVVMLNQLPAIPDNRAYQLWMIHGSSAHSAGVLDLKTPDGTTQVLRADVAGADAFGVTVEPTGGSATPTMPIIAQVPLS